MLATTRRPRPLPTSKGSVDHSGLAEALAILERSRTRGLARIGSLIDAYLRTIAEVEPDTLDETEALAFWINLYNAGALRLASIAAAQEADSVLRVPGGFRRNAIAVAGELFSLDAIEHGKIRRFGDPRIHAALVCGSVSCPTLRPEPYRGSDLDKQLGDQMRRFLESGASIGGDGTVTLSRVFLWYGADFVHPHRMPTLIPVRNKRVLDAIAPWLPDQVAEALTDSEHRVVFAPYDWGLRCSVA